MTATAPPFVPTLDALRARIRDLERGGSGSEDGPPGGRALRIHPTGWPGLDGALPGGIPRGVVTEWIGIGDPGLADAAAGEAWTRARPAPEGAIPKRGDREARAAAGPAAWVPPLALLVQGVARALEPPIRCELPDAGAPDDADGAPGPVLWIGRAVWPYGRALVRTAGPATVQRTASAARLHARSLFVDVPDDGARLWALDLALRCRAVAAVVADGHGLPWAASRRLAVAAAAGDAMAWLVRPPEERHAASAAAVRLVVERVPVGSRAAQGTPVAEGGQGLGGAAARLLVPRWRVVLVRAKGAAAGEGSARAGAGGAAPAVLLETAHVPEPRSGVPLHGDHDIVECPPSGTESVEPPAVAVDSGAEPPSGSGHPSGREAQPGGGAAAAVAVPADVGDGPRAAVAGSGRRRRRRAS